MHHEIEVLYCISGTLHAKLNGIKYLIKADEALIIGSMTDHELVGGKDGCSLLSIEFGPMLLREKFTYLSELKFDNPILSFSDSENRAFNGIRDSIYELVNTCGNKSVELVPVWDKDKTTAVFDSESVAFKNITIGALFKIRMI